MCKIDYCDLNFTVLTDEFRKAKRLHKCCECGRQITRGEHYNYESGVSDDRDFEVYKTCRHCLQARMLICDKCYGYVYNEVKEDLLEHVNVPKWGRLAARYYVGMRRKWKKFKSDGLMPIIRYTPPKIR
jgi:hypothetical protein